MNLKMKITTRPIKELHIEFKILKEIGMILITPNEVFIINTQKLIQNYFTKIESISNTETPKCINSIDNRSNILMKQFPYLFLKQRFETNSINQLQN